MEAVPREIFETLVWDAVRSLPPQFRRRIENLSFLVEPWASAEDRARTGTIGHGQLLGVYRGVPLTHRTSGYQMTLPDVVVIFQEPLQRIARDEDHLRQLVHHTVRHEIAHYFGISDRRLRELGAY
jgi:predicted Zn-dependent protease with MMP-like domain